MTAAATGEHLLGELVRFGRALQAAGLAVGTDRVLAFARAVAALGPRERDDLYWAGRLTMVARPEDLPAYDRVFAAFFPTLARRQAAMLADLAPRAPGPLRMTLGDRQAPPTPQPSRPRRDGEAPGQERAGLVASATEALRHKSFERLTPAERAATHAAIRGLSVRLPLRSSRRQRAAPGGARLDLRRTVRRSLATEGEPLRRAWRRRRRRPRPLLLLLDVSGSMSAHSRALLQFGYAAARAGQRVEVFCFGTRLTRLTRTLRHSDPDAALREAATAVRDWDGGTRIGASVKALVDGYGQRTCLRGAVVVLCSDGLERGDPAVLDAQLDRLRRLSHRLVWVNPLKGSPGYQPLARGMSAALPHVDAFLPGHDLASLERLCEVVAAAS